MSIHYFLEGFVGAMVSYSFLGAIKRNNKKGSRSFPVSYYWYV